MPLQLQLLQPPPATPQLLVSRVPAFAGGKAFAFVYGSEALEDKARLAALGMPLLLSGDVESVRVLDVASARSVLIRRTSRAEADVDAVLEALVD